MFKQGGKVRDYIFPIIAGSYNSNRATYFATGFTFGRNGYAITAAHVIKEIEKNQFRSFALFANEDTSWTHIPIMSYEVNDAADVAILQLPGQTWISPFSFGDSVNIHSSSEYFSFGYPKDAAFDNSLNGFVEFRPDMTHISGYIRRRIGNGIDAIKGKFLFELSDIGGVGFSGSPVFLKGQIKNVIGLYTHEKINDGSVMVAYAAMTQDFMQWKPKLLGKTLLEESIDGASRFPAELFDPSL
jgi:hypothetical protein